MLNTDAKFSEVFVDHIGNFLFGVLTSAVAIFIVWWIIGWIFKSYICSQTIFIIDLCGFAETSIGTGVITIIGMLLVKRFYKGRHSFVFGVIFTAVCTVLFIAGILYSLLYA